MTNYEHYTYVQPSHLSPATRAGEAAWASRNRAHTPHDVASIVLGHVVRALPTYEALVAARDHQTRMLMEVLL